MVDTLSPPDAKIRHRHFVSIFLGSLQSLPQAQYAIHQLLREGALAFVVSEFNNQPYWIENFAAQLLLYWKNADVKNNLVILRTIAQDRWGILLDVDSVYQDWFESIYEKISELPTRDSGGFGSYSRCYVHESEFISKIPVGDVHMRSFFVKRCVEGFLDYLEMKFEQGIV